MCDFWWIEWNWNRFISLYFGSSCQLYVVECSVFVCVYLLSSLCSLVIDSFAK